MEAVDDRIAVALPAGDVDVSATWVRPDDAWGVIAVAHGAGTGYAHPFLTGFTDAANGLGLATVRFNFPYSEAGRRMPGPAPHAVATWSAVAARIAYRMPDLPWWAAGKSYGGRMASMAAAEGVIDPAGLVYLGYPLHPPAEPAKARVAHLPDIRQPQLYVEGTNDPFVDPHSQLEATVASCQDAKIVWIDGGGHSFEVKGRKRPADEIGGDLAPLVAEWIRSRV